MFNAKNAVRRLFRAARRRIRAARPPLLPAAILGAAVLMTMAGGCRQKKMEGPRIWWDDNARQRLPDHYRLPEDLLEGTDRDPNRFDQYDPYGLY